MLKKLIELFKPKSFHCQMEEYINSKNPTCEADVERLMRQYTLRRGSL